jgi:CIC family chloride channel protein
VALAAELYCRYVVRLHELRQRLRIPLPATLAGVGVAIGAVDAMLPPDFINRAAIRQAVAEGDVDLSRALAIFLVLFLSTGLAAAAGTPGGLFAPMLTLGGTLGLAIAEVMHQLGAEAPSTAVFAGMGAFLAACARAPITATFLTFAVTKELLLLKPILVACIGSVVMAGLLHPSSIFQRLIPPEPSRHRPAEVSMGSVPLRPRLRPAGSSDHASPG